MVCLTVKYSGQNNSCEQRLVSLCGDGRPRPSNPSEARQLPAATMTLGSLQQIKLQPHFVRSLKPKLFVQVPTLGAGVQIDGAKAPLLDPGHDG